jgi:hypothetical protein
MTDWTLPLEQLPEEVPFEELPPVAQALVRRNVLLRAKLAAAEAEVQALKQHLAALQTTKPA